MPDTVLKNSEFDSSLGEQLAQELYSIALEENLIDESALTAYRSMRGKSFKDPARLESYINGFKNVSEDQRLAMSRLLGLETQLLNAMHNADRKQRMDSVENSIYKFLSNGLAKAGDKIDEFVDELAKVKKEAIISIIHTTHPTVYHSADSIKFENDITVAVESHAKGNRDISNVKQQITGLIRGRIREISEKPISHARKITVTEESSIETDNIRELKKYAEEFEKGWAASIARLKSEAKLSEANAQKLAADKLKVEWRTWGMAADADGRPNSTSIEVYNSIQNNLSKDGVYNGSTLDLRQNAAEHADVVSGLIQRLYNMSDKTRYGTNNAFKTLCENFVKGINKDVIPENWKSPKESILQELDKEQQSDFIKLVLNQGFELLPKNVAKETMEFNKQFHPLFTEFVKEHKAEIRAKGYDPNKVTFTELYNILDQDGVPLQDILAEQVYEKIKMPGGKNFEITPQGYYMHKKHASPTHLLLSRGRKMDEDGEQRPLTQEERVVLVDVIKRLQIVNDALDHAAPGSPPVADRHQIANFESTRDFYTLLTLFKETGIVEMQYHGEGAEKKATVTKAKMGIQPLLETSNDMRNAPEMFAKLLADPLARSYYETRGVGEFMVGFSDGARSAGNFASEWEIHQCMKKLNETFEKAEKEYGMKHVPLRFFRGHGRGADRGGPIEYGIEDYILPDVEAAKAIRDETWQSDLPLDMRMSPSYGNDTFTQSALGTMQAAVVARGKLKQQTQADKERDASYEAAITYIAKMSEGKYRSIVSDDTYPPFKSENNPNQRWDEAGAKSLALINLTPDQKDKTSRPAVRNASPSFQKTRAIGVEYGFNMAGLPAHNVGLANALNEFAKSGMTVKTRDGRDVSGEEALIELYQNSRFFRGVINKVDKGMDIFNPEVARRYAKSAAKKEVRDVVQQHVESIIGDLQGLPDRIHTLVTEARKKDKTVLNINNQNAEGAKVQPPGFAEFWYSDQPFKSPEAAAWTQRVNRDTALSSATAVDQHTLALMGQGLLLSYDGKHNVKKGQNPNMFETVRNAIFTVSERVSNRFSSWSLRDMAVSHTR